MARLFTQRPESSQFWSITGLVAKTGEDELELNTSLHRRFDPTEQGVGQLKREMSQIIADIEAQITTPEFRGHSLTADEISDMGREATWEGAQERMDEVRIIRVDANSGRPDILYAATGGGGGYILRGSAQKNMPEYLRLGDIKEGFYEIGTDWMRVATIYPDYYTPRQQKTAESGLRNLFPSAWETHYDQRLLPGESFARDKEDFLIAHADDLIMMQARASPGNDSLMIVTAVPGGDLTLMGTDQEKTFVMPYSDIYDGGEAASPGRDLGVVLVDPTKYPEYVPEGEPSPGM
ncbi:hypothetical protein AA14337_3000 [Acetobacter malorum DSM 14337]|uniref:DUF7007 domain-containing protein n=1 Tax=Acetobacter malorum DSM 14337 TaxID=1307910 RepID=A0ABQ0PYZ2_9PROT|nr:hypothetical protein AA14337_3000 [Acetobacter malorum DSM 14337]